MCGIAGYLARHDVHATDVLLRMTTALAHRGPDGAGAWTDGQAGVALGHRRLAILDPSDAGAQPMLSGDGRFVVTFNGEIYNHAELRDALDGTGRTWRGHSDTEVLLEACSAWGVHRALARAVGMFALALWDRHRGVLTLARDRLGEKPLYWADLPGAFLFGSELRALRHHPAWEGRLNAAAVDLLLRFDYIPAPHTIFERVHKLEAGSLLEVRAGGSPVLDRYWSPEAVFEAGANARFRGSESDAATELERHLRTAVAGQMLADRPLGAFLSGGIDSSTVVSLMQAQASQPVRTFTIGFAEDDYDEAGPATAVARHLGTDHMVLRVGHEDVLGVVPSLARIYDEPFADASQIPMVILARLVREHVIVALSGDGGDELFGGYPRYHRGLRLQRATNWLPAPARRWAGRQMAALVPAPGLSPAPDSVTRYRLAGIARRLTQPDAESAYHASMARWRDPGSAVLGVDEPPELVARERWARLGTGAEMMMYQDLVSYLPEDLMTKVDRATMAVGLEARAPFLDHRVVEFAASLPLEWKLHSGRSKRLVRTLLHRHVPPALVDRPKHGFGPPIREWLAGPLLAWASHHLSPERLADSGVLDVPRARALWEQHRAGTRHWTGMIWSLLAFQAWCEAWREGARA